MRWWVALSSLCIAGVAHGAPAPRLPLASGFDLTSLVTRPRFANLSPSPHDAARCIAPDIAPPPGPPDDPPKLRIRGKKVKFRMAF
jgi:hypothetical protein